MSKGSPQDASCSGTQNKEGRLRTSQKPAKKKVKHEMIDLTDVKRVKKEMPKRIDGEGLSGASRDDPIVIS